jgi:RHS repeat-associated protein
MNSTALSKPLNSENVRKGHAHDSHSEIRRCIVATLGTLLLALGAHSLDANVGNENPAGVSGIFNGNLENTGVDPWTGNAIRSITDILVAGAVGEYPLALVRTANSRALSTTEVFSWSGGWNHNYNWILEDSSTGPIDPTSYTVEFPDGRVETFKSVGWDTAGYYRVRANNGGSAGVRERFVPLNRNTMYAYLILSDGGKVEFKAAQHVNGSQYWYKYYVTAIYDPHGLKTTIASAMAPNGARRRITQVTEPAGRYLQFTYLSTNGSKISKVTASDGRMVQYYYACCNNWALDHVVYYNNANWTARYQYTNSNIGGQLPPLLRTADDPMYSGPMKRISYEYKTGTNADQSVAVYGQVYKVRYWNGTAGQENSGPVVSTLTVGSPNNNRVYRTETRGDGATRVFIYNGAGAGYLAWASDFTNSYASQTYDAKRYINSVTDRRGNTTDYTNDPITGNVTQIKYPLTQGDTPGQSLRPAVNYTYTNNYYLHTTQGENGFTTTITRDGNNRVSRIDYPDGGYESFTYDSAHLYQVSTHRITTGGTESWAYDGLHKLQYYSDPYHSNPGNPSIQYFYEGHGWVNGIFDALGHPTNWTYNDRGQVLVTTLATDPVDNRRHTINNAYNDDGTLQSKTDELNHITTYTYDDYRRLKSVTTPVRGFGDNGTNTTSVYYGANPVDNANDYIFTDANVSYTVLPSGKKTKSAYDDNRRKQSVTVGYGSGNDATTNYAYDNVGNLTTITNPRNQDTTTFYDERNRPSSINDRGRVTTFTYDTAGRRKSIQRPNGQLITNNAFDAMNRVTQQTATQTPDPDAVTKYTYYSTADGPTAPVGLLKYFKDPRISGTTYNYKYEYDLMGRKTKLTYPPPTQNGQQTSEQWSYDTASRLQTFTNRDGKIQTFTYDALNRMIRSDWNDSTPDVTFGYDAASRVTAVNNANANIARAYYNDNLLYAEAEQILVAGGTSKTVSYTYNSDGYRDSLTTPDYTVGYGYNGRNQLLNVGAFATYTYDQSGYTGDLTMTVLGNGGGSLYAYDALDRAVWITHVFANSISHVLEYNYDNASGNRMWAKRHITRAGSPEDQKGEVFRYDLADQANGVQLDVSNPDQLPLPQRSIIYDANGNRTSFFGDTYATNNLNQYTTRNGSGANYDTKGNLGLGFDGSMYQYDAQNRLTSAAGMTFKYDGLNRQVSRTWNGTTTFSVWDGWDLVEEYQGATPTAAYVYGATGLIAGALNGQVYYYYQDGSGSTSHLADNNGVLKEWYRYDLHGTPFFYNANDTQLSASNYSVRHLFTGQQLYKEIGLYDLRNRFYSPDIGRFLQPDPIGFKGGNNLYRYCGNNPVTRWDPFGLQAPTDVDGGGAPGGVAEVEPVIVYGDPIVHEILVGLPGFGVPDGFSGPGEFGLGGHMVGDKFVNDYNPFPRLPENHQPSVEHAPPSSVPPQNPQPPVSAATLAPPPATLTPLPGVFSNWQQMPPTAIARAMAFSIDRTYRDNGRANPNGVYLTHYGPGTRIGGWDPTNDSGTNRGVGNHENQLNGNSLAISPDVVRNYNLTLGGPVFVNGQYLGNYDDTPGRPGTIDIYDYNNAAGTMWGGMLWNPIISPYP